MAHDFGPSASRASFQTTQWTDLEQAKCDGAPTPAFEALSRFCDAYRKPVLASAIAKGLNPADAEDATQEFFQKLLRNNFLRNVSRGNGRFRTYLLTSLDHHLANLWTRAHAQKRGAFAAHSDLDAAAHVADKKRTPEEEFACRWLIALTQQVLAVLESEYEAAGRGHLYQTLKPFLVGAEESRSESISSKLKVSEGAARTALCRLRGRYRVIFRDEVAKTVSNPRDVDDEMQYLLRVARNL